MPSVETDREAEIWSALAEVVDPELDDSVTELGFIEEVGVDADARVHVGFRLPTYWCSANFAFLMADDMHRAVSGLSWVGSVEIILRDHMYETEVNAGMAGGLSFKEAFGDLAIDETLDALRDKFRRKAFQRRQEAVLRGLMQQGIDAAALCEMTVSSLKNSSIEDGEGARQKPRYLELLQDFGWAGSPDLPAFVTLEGVAISVIDFKTHLGELRSVRINMEFNGVLCRGLQRARYWEPTDAEPTLADFIQGSVPRQSA